MSDVASPFELAHRLQNGLIDTATSGGFDWNEEYIQLRSLFMKRPDTRRMLPDFVLSCRDLSQFWRFIQPKLGKYAQRRAYLYDEFRPLLDYLEEVEQNERAPAAVPIGEILRPFDPEHVHAAWQKALERRTNDPEGAITAARTLIETVCKHILVAYTDSADLPKLWALAAEEVNLAPQQHQEAVFKAILGNCQSVVNHLASIRNKIGDAHGKGRNPVKPKPRHAELAVNLAGTMASFLVATWQEKKKRQ